MTAIQLAGITVYPVKSAGGIAVTEWEVEARGLRWDRRWVVTDPAGQFFTQRDHPRLALVRPTLLRDALRLEAPGLPPLEVPLAAPDGAPKVPVVVWEDSTWGVVVDGGAGEWFTRLLGVPSRLVFMPDDVVRPVDPTYGQPADQVSFADGFPFLLISQASLDDLNGRLAVPLPMNRFRPNLVVRGCAPFAEDGWRRFETGGISFRVVKPCARCVVTTTDQETLVRGREPLRTLATYRNVGGKVMFGQNVIHDRTGRLELGSPVALLR
ncbi:MAG TPA: MOSC N-terminal beta barrel domain-containing protein [Gemmatimonadales bacterium]|nr:MOSC N-terminal beta barrel domain-containing protein [Gemmatimonadales bacterium]